MPSDENLVEITDIEPEEIKVGTAPAVVKTAIGTEEFTKAFSKVLASGSPWRTPESLALKLGVDVVELVKWMDRIPQLVRKPGKEDGVFYYGFTPKPPAAEEKKLTRPVVTEEDRYCAAMLHMTYGNLLHILEKYAIRIHDKSKESFAALMEARDKMSAGLVLFQNAAKVEVDKLPKL